MFACKKLLGLKKKLLFFSYNFVFKKASLSSNFNEDIKGNPRITHSLKNFSSWCKIISFKTNFKKMGEKRRVQTVP